MVDIQKPPYDNIYATRWDQIYPDPKWQDYRRQIVDYILTKVCNVDTCRKTGSDKPTSDVDITILDANQISNILNNLQNVLLQSFTDVELTGSFQDEIQNLCKTSTGEKRCEQDQQYMKILRLLDINVYYTNFEVHVESQTFHIIEKGTAHIQRYFAYSAWPDKRPKELMQDPCLQECNIENYKNKSRLPNNSTANNLINCISKWSTEQRDAYVTQGSYLRWVLDMPYDKLKTFQWILKDCMIEQVCMAHKALFSSKRQDLLGCFKYLSRAYNTIDPPLDFVFIEKTISQNLKDFLNAKTKDNSVEYNRIIVYLREIFKSANVKSAMEGFIAYINDTYRGIYDPPLGIETCLDSPQEIKRFSEIFGLITPNQSFMKQNAGTVNPEYLTILGRLRRVYTYSRKKYVNIRGKLVTIKEAREIERQIRNQQRQKQNYNKTNARV